MVNRKDNMSYYESLVSDLEFNNRILNVLKNERIFKIKDLITMSEPELLRFPSLGRKGVNQIKEILQSRNLFLGMKLGPQHIESNLVTDLQYEIIAKTEKVFSQSCQLITDLLNKKKEATFDEIDQMFKQHKMIVSTLEKSLKNLFE